MLEVQHLTKRYGKTLAVDDVSFTVNTGRIGILLGPNGAGKSTVIKSIAGLLKYEGGIGINQIPSKSMEAKRIFAYVPEIPALFPMLNVAEHMEYIRRAYNPGTTEEEIQTILQAYHPVFFEMIPLSLEEIFISETEVAGYDIKRLVF